MPPHADLIIVGAGVVGLAHAVAGLDAGLRVLVVDRDARANLASVRNFGHLGASAQSGELRELGVASRPAWHRLAADAGVPLRAAGTLVVARTDAEAALLEAAHERGAIDRSVLVGAATANALLGRPRDAAGAAPVSALHLTDDLVSAPRETVARIAAWVDAHPRGEVRFGAHVREVETGRIRLADGTELTAGTIIVAAGHLLGELLPASAAGVRRCLLQMVRVAAPDSRRIDPAVLSGTSMIRYGAFADLPEAQQVRAALERTSPELLAADVNLMLTQQPDGTLFLGDTHRSDDVDSPFLDERIQTDVLRAGAELLGVARLDVIERWMGVYALDPSRSILHETPMPGVHAIAVTTGVGMTIALGLGARTIAGI